MRVTRFGALACLLAVLGVLCGETAFANPMPVAGYLFPAGGQRGTTVKVRVGGLNLHDKCGWELCGTGVVASKHLVRTKTRWFEGPRLPLPDSQRQENYPQDMLGEVVVAKDAALGVRRGRLWTSEGADAGLAFVVGDLPEIVEDEVDGDPVPITVKLPITINGRIFPREDIDIWSFVAKKGQSFACEVHAARFGSPLDSRLEVRDPDGKVVAENDDSRLTDSFLTFTAPVDGTYQVRISDSQRAGSQRHVYRLTISDGPYVGHVYPLGGRKGTKPRFTLTGANVPKDPVELALDEVGARPRAFDVSGKTTNAVTLDVDDLPEFLESEPKDSAKANQVSLPCVLNGRIDRPGDVDQWRFDAKKGQTLEFTMRSLVLGSPMASVVEILDSTGKVVHRSEPRFYEFRYTVSQEGSYTLRIRDQFRTRGGANFVYRLRVREAKPDFTLYPYAVAHGLVRGSEAPLRTMIARTGGFSGPVTLTVKGLPAGVTAAPVTAPGGQPQPDIRLKCDKDARIEVSRIQIIGTATIDGKTVERVARTQLMPDDQPIDDTLLAVVIRAPFKIVGAYDLRLAPRGSVFRKKFTVERNGYTGPLEIRLADKQARHLQGVSGPTISIAGTVNEFEYPIALPPWMETGRTARACVMGIGRMNIDGVEHTVSYTSQEQKDQIIAVVETGQLGLELGKSSLVAKPGATVDVPVSVRRAKGLTGAVKIEVVVSGGDIVAEALTIASDKNAGTLQLRFADKSGARSVSIVVKATLATLSGPVVAEAKVEAVRE